MDDDSDNDNPADYMALNEDDEPDDGTDVSLERWLRANPKRRADPLGAPRRARIVANLSTTPRLG